MSGVDGAEGVRVADGANEARRSPRSHEAEVIAIAISYAEDRAMAGAYFPDWQTCADMLRAMCADRDIQIGGTQL